MLKGQVFKAYHKALGTISYMYCGIDETVNNCCNIRLLNLDDNTDTYVEQEWFNQRMIIL